jgi:hypothetical protein
MYYEPLSNFRNVFPRYSYQCGFDIRHYQNTEYRVSILVTFEKEWKILVNLFKECSLKYTNTFCFAYNHGNDIMYLRKVRNKKCYRHEITQQIRTLVYNATTLQNLKSYIVYCWGI